MAPYDERTHIDCRTIYLAKYEYRAFAARLGFPIISLSRSIEPGLRVKPALLHEKLQYVYAVKNFLVAYRSMSKSYLLSCAESKCSVLLSPYSTISISCRLVGVRQQVVQYLDTVDLLKSVDFYAPQLYRQVLLRRVLAMSVCPSVCHDPVVYQDQVR